MSETVICNRCGEPKPTTRYGLYKNRSGEKIRRLTCIDCYTEMNRERKGIKSDRKTNSLKSKTIYNNDIESSASKINKKNEMVKKMFSDEQIEKLYLLANNADKLIEILDNKIAFEKDENNRTKKTVLINTSIHEIIEKKQKKTNLNYSDILNLILKKGLEYID